MKYRIVHFVPDMMQGWRIPVAAILSVNSSLSIVRAERMPCSHCIGGDKFASALRLLLNALEYELPFEKVPISIQPIAVFDDIRNVSFNVSDPVDWISRFVLPNYKEIIEENKNEQRNNK